MGNKINPIADSLNREMLIRAVPTVAITSGFDALQPIQCLAHLALAQCRQHSMHSMHSDTVLMPNILSPLNMRTAICDLLQDQYIHQLFPQPLGAILAYIALHPIRGLAPVLTDIISGKVYFIQTIIFYLVLFFAEIALLVYLCVLFSHLLLLHLSARRRKVSYPSGVNCAV